MKLKIKNISILNTLSNLLLQIVYVISGFVLPKIILSNFGSEVNGLVSSLNQLLGYISLLEGGITGVIMANLYKPLYNKDYDKLSSVVATTEHFYKKIAFIFIIYSFILAIVYPIIFNVSFSYMYVFSLTLILTINLFMQYNFSLTLKTILNADKKVYIVSISQSILIIINIFLALISVKIYPSIHLLKILTSIMFFIQPLIYKYFVNKYYDIDKNAKMDNNLLKSRWNGFAINIAAIIHNNTDVAVLTFFTNLKIVSVYSIYKLVVTGLSQLVNAIAAAIAPSIGHLYASGNTEELNKKFDIYEFIMFFLVFLVFTVAGLLITPFVMIYTKNINDANYYQPIFGILILLSEAVYILKAPHTNLAYAANKFKELTIPAYIEAGLNIVTSIILVIKFGLIGVAIGTLVAMIYRTTFQVIFLKKNILNRTSRIFFTKVLIFGLSTVLGILICIFIVPKVQYTIISWILHGVIYSFVMFIIYILISIFFYRYEFKNILKIIKK